MGRTHLFLGHALIIFFMTQPHYLFYDTTSLSFFGTNLIIFFIDTPTLSIFGDIKSFFFCDTPHHYFCDITSILFLEHLHYLFLGLIMISYFGTLPNYYFWDTLHLHFWDTAHKSCRFGTSLKETPSQYFFMTHNILWFFLRHTSFQFGHPHHLHLEHSLNKFIYMKIWIHCLHVLINIFVLLLIKKKSLTYYINVQKSVDLVLFT